MYQSHRLPISFLAGIFGGPQLPVSDKMTREELFIPYRLVLSNGETSHWVLDKKNPLFETLWSETETYLGNIAQGKLKSVNNDSGSWGDITSRRGFVFEFKEDIRSDLLKWFLGISNSAVELPNVYKIMVIPENNERSNTIYIYNSKGQIFKYSSEGNAREKSFQEILAGFEAGSQDTYREYITMHDSNFDRNLSVEPDILYVSRGRDYWPYNTVSCSIPEKINNMDQLAEAILGSEKERYSQNSYNDGTIQFSNTDNVYKIYTGGIIEYKYLPASDSSDKATVGDALLNAYGFIKKAMALTNSKADIYLSGAELLETGCYRFKFDYMINGNPVYINLASAGSGKDAANAITIEADGKRVLTSRIILRDFSISGKNNYNDRFLDIMSNSNSNYRQVQIKDIAAGYVVDSVKNGKLEPVMVVENKNVPGIQAFKMPEQKGD